MKALRASDQRSVPGGMPALAAPVREGVSRSQTSFVSFVVKAVSRRGAKGRYQNGCRYQRRYLISADCKAVRGKGSEVATSEPIFFDRLTCLVATPFFRVLKFPVTYCLLLPDKPERRAELTFRSLSHSSLNHAD